MYVNPFWFGVLLTIILEIVVAFIYAFVQIKRAERYEEECRDEEDDRDV